MKPIIVDVEPVHGSHAHMTDNEVLLLKSLQELVTLFDEGIAGVDHRGFQREGEAKRYTRVLMEARRIVEKYN